jgi:hypothetical protein
MQMYFIPLKVMVALCLAHFAPGFAEAALAGASPSKDKTRNIATTFLIYGY